MPIRIPPRRNRRRALPEQRVQNPGKGLNTLVSDTLIKDEEASDLQNVQFIESGVVAKRPGFVQVGDALTANPKGLGVIYTTSGTRQLLTIDGTSLKYLNGATWTAISGKTFTTAKETTFVQALDAVYIWNGTDAGGKYDGTTLSTPTTTPSAAFGIYYSGYQIVSGVATKPHRLYISVSTDPSDFTNTAGELSTSGGVPGATAFAGTGANYVDISSGDGDSIKGLAKFSNALIIFKERSIHQLTFDSTGTPVVTPITTSIGSVSHKGIDNVENDVFFPTRNGYYVLGNEPNYFNVIRSNELSQRVNPTIQNITASNLSKIASIYSGFVFYSSVPYGGTTTNNRLLTYDRRYLAWSLSTNINANAFTEFIDTTNNKHLYFAADDDTYIYELLPSTYNDDGTAIDAYWQGKAHSGGKTELYKFWVDCTVTFRQVSGTVTIKLIDDEGVTQATATVSSANDTYGSMGMDQLGAYYMGGAANPDATSNTATSTNNVPYRILLNKYARTMKLRVENANNNETFGLLEYVFTYRAASHYQFPSANILR